jgi:hypothetical protein
MASMTNAQKIALLGQIKSNREILIERRFSTTRTEDDVKNKWIELYEWCKVNNYPFVDGKRDYKHIRDNVWAYFKRVFVSRDISRLPSD